MSVTFDLVVAVKNYVDNHPTANAWDIVAHFKELGVPDNKTLAILRELFG